MTRCFDSNREGMTEDGVEDAFDVNSSNKIDDFSFYVSWKVIHEIEDVVKTGIWVGDCFIYTNSVNRLNYFVGGEIVTISHLDR